MKFFFFFEKSVHVTVLVFYVKLQQHKGFKLAPIVFWGKILNWGIWAKKVPKWVLKVLLQINASSFSNFLHEGRAAQRLSFFVTIRAETILVVSWIYVFYFKFVALLLLCFQGVEKGCIGNEWVKIVRVFNTYLIQKLFNSPYRRFIYTFCYRNRQWRNNFKQKIQRANRVPNTQSKALFLFSFILSKE